MNILTNIFTNISLRIFRQGHSDAWGVRRQLARLNSLLWASSCDFSLDFRSLCASVVFEGRLDRAFGSLGGRRSARAARRSDFGSISGVIFDRFSSVSAARALAQRKWRHMRFDCACAVETHVGRPARNAKIAKKRSQIDARTGAHANVAKNDLRPRSNASWERPRSSRERSGPRRGVPGDLGQK